MDNKLNNIPENDTASSDSNPFRESFSSRYKRPLIGGAALLAVAAVSFKAGQYSMTPAFNDLVTAADNASAKAVNESGLEELTPAGESPATDQASDKNAGPDKDTAVDKPDPKPAPEDVKPGPADKPGPVDPEGNPAADKLGPGTAVIKSDKGPGPEAPASKDHGPGKKPAADKRPAADKGPAADKKPAGPAPAAKPGEAVKIIPG